MKHNQLTIIVHLTLGDKPKVGIYELSKKYIVSIEHAKPDPQVSLT